MPGAEPVLLLGASGRVGRLLRASWALSPPPGLHVVSQWRGPDTPERVLVWSPLDGPDALLAHARNHGAPTAMIMLAGVTPVSDGDPDLNRQLAVAALEAARAAGCPRVLVASSSVVYGRGAGRPVPEEAPLAPVTPYGIAKRDMEAACAPYRDGGLEVCCLRIGNVLGADALMINADAGLPLTIDRFADGNGPVRSFIGPQSLARALETLVALPEPLPKVLNVGAPRPTEMTAIADAAGLPWRWQPAPDGALQDLTLDCTRLAGLHAFAPRESTPEGMVEQLRRIGAGARSSH